MKNLIWILVASFLLMGCEEKFHGTLELKRNWKFKNNVSSERIEYCKIYPNDYFCKDVNTEMPAGPTKISKGVHSVKIEIKKEYASLKFNNIKGEPKVRLKIPKDKKLPQHNGQFSLTAKEIGQRFSVSGTIDTNTEESSVYSDVESCTYVVYVRKCRGRVSVHPPRGKKGKGKRKGNGQGGRVCKKVAETQYGYQDVEYKYVTTTKDLNLDFVNPKTSRVIGVYTGTHSDSNKDYLYKGICQ